MYPLLLTFYSLSLSLSVPVVVVVCHSSLEDVRGLRNGLSWLQASSSPLTSHKLFIGFYLRIIYLYSLFYFLGGLNNLLLSPPAGLVDTQSILDTFTPPSPSLVPVPLPRAVKLPQLWAVEPKWRDTLNILQPLALLGLDGFNTL